MSREYFKGIEALYEYNAIVNFSEVFKTLYIPQGFKKQLDSAEKTALLNDQLREKGLMAQNLRIDGCSRIVEKNKHAVAIERTRGGISNRLREYLEKFHADEEAGLI